MLKRRTLLWGSVAAGGALAIGWGIAPPRQRLHQRVGAALADDMAAAVHLLGTGHVDGADRHQLAGVDGGFAGIVGQAGRQWRALAGVAVFSEVESPLTLSGLKSSASAAWAAAGSAASTPAAAARRIAVNGSVISRLGHSSG